MSFPKATFDAHAVVQKYIPLPYLADKLNYRFIPNLLYNNVYHVVFRKTVFTIFWCYVVFDVVYLWHLLVLYKVYGITYGSHFNGYLDKFVVYVTRSCFDALIAISIIVITTNHTILQYLVTQLCKMVRFDTNSGYKMLQKGLLNFICGKFTFEEASFNCMVGVIPFASLCFFAAPFAWSFLPLQILFGHSLVVNIVSSLQQGIQWGYIIWYLISSIQLFISILELAEIYTSDLTVKLDMSKCCPQKAFMKLYIKYRRMQILTIVTNQATANVSLVFIYVGVLCGSVCTYTTLTGRASFQFWMYLIFPIVSVHAFALSILVPNYAATFSNNICKYLQFWKMHCIKKEERKVLRSCPIYGVKAASYGFFTAQTGLQICDDIISNTVTLMLTLKLPQ